ncbi:endonuclease domain-containing 1 protein-like, partial [Clarias magur]
VYFCSPSLHKHFLRTPHTPHTYTHSSHTPHLCIRMKLVALVLLLSTFFSLSLTEVVENVQQWKSECGSFFMKNPRNEHDIIYPTIFPGCQYKMICQRWTGEYRFATVYDTERRIPVYSAYTFFRENENKRPKKWKVEPQ